MAESSSANPSEGEQLGRKAGLAAAVNALHVESSSQIKFKPQTQVIKLSKAHKALPHVYRVLQNELVHDTRAKASLAANHAGAGSRGLVNYDSDGGSTPTQATFNASLLANKAKIPTKSSFPTVVKCTIVDENGSKDWVFQDELVLAERDISLKAMYVAAKKVREAATPEDRLARLSEMSSWVDKLPNDVEEEQDELEKKQKKIAAKQQNLKELLELFDEVRTVFY
ncbi:hypothetical protein LTR84_013125 [Exophiala bonariae]|uniref:Uncharacterized protein n=1 Tax=Exophiala bonariae TaxID=1690606 RepID=A0AAV9NGG1_9EURO|nr:hypothetical protein LTR84_013125 [Exophiala bonariae]